MRIGIYNQHMHRMGGGEQYICTIAELLSINHSVDLLTTQPVDKRILCDKLNLDLTKVNLIILPINDEVLNSLYSQQYDLFINGSYYSKLVNYSRIGIIIIFFPILNKHKVPKIVKIFLYKILNIFFKGPIVQYKNKLLKKIYNRYVNEKFFLTHDDYLKSYKSIISISKYTHFWIKKNSSKNSIILYPPVNIKNGNTDHKQNIILSVGRFFNTDHNKKQYEMIRMFKKMYDTNPELKNYEYHLCGGKQLEKIHSDYFNLCSKEAYGYPIVIHPDISFDELNILYMKSKIFWHATGFNEDIKKTPDRFEHFGITTIEAMSAGVVPVVICKAGQKEVVNDGYDGYLWISENQCITKTLKLINNEKLLYKISKQAIASSQKYSKHNFQNNFEKILTTLIN